MGKVGLLDVHYMYSLTWLHYYTIPSLSSVKYFVISLHLIPLAIFRAFLIISIMDIGLFVPDVLSELNSPSVVKPLKHKRKYFKCKQTPGVNL